MNMAPRHQPLVLASTSTYRQRLLTRLGLDFATAAPRVDERRRPGETPAALVRRLAIAKAEAVAPDFPDALIIGSDQVACIDDQVLGKPGGRAAAIAQLLQASGREAVFQTGLCLLNAARGTHRVIVEPFRVRFRSLRPDAVAAYVDRERPFDCAGGFKAEGLGIALFESLDGADPNALIGLPLIRLVTLLADAGLDVLAVPER